MRFRAAPVAAPSSRACAASSSAIAASMSSMSNDIWQRDSTVLVEAEQLEHSSCGAPGLTSAVPTSSRVRARRSPRTATTARSEPHCAVSIRRRHFAEREKIVADEADYLPAALDGDDRPRTAARPRPRPRDRQRRRGGGSLARTRCRARRSAFRVGAGQSERPLAENAPRLLGKCRSAFPFVQVDRPLGGGPRPRAVAGGIQHRRQRQAGVAVIDQGVGALGQATASSATRRASS